MVLLGHHYVFSKFWGRRLVIGRPIPRVLDMVVAWLSLAICWTSRYSASAVLLGAIIFLLVVFHTSRPEKSIRHSGVVRNIGCNGAGRLPIRAPEGRSGGCGCEWQPAPRAAVFHFALPAPRFRLA